MTRREKQSVVEQMSKLRDGRYKTGFRSKHTRRD
jgi:hypothetical protein